MLEMNRYFKNKKCHLGLVHGDLSFNNILLSTNKIYIIDWSDCRYDVLSADISQLFYLCKFNKKQKGIFLKNYSACYIDNKILLSHYILLLVYDIIDYYNKNNKIYISKNKELEKIIKDYAN